MERATTSRCGSRLWSRGPYANPLLVVHLVTSSSFQRVVANVNFTVCMDAVMVQLKTRLSAYFWWNNNVLLLTVVIKWTVNLIETILHWYQTNLEKWTHKEKKNIFCSFLNEYRWKAKWHFIMELVPFTLTAVIVLLEAPDVQERVWDKEWAHSLWFGRRKVSNRTGVFIV